MNDRIAGSFPGGPQRRTSAAKRTSAPRLRRVEDIEARAARQQIRRSQGRRQKRVFFAMLVSVVLAGAAGTILGVRNRTSLEQVRAEVAAETASADMSDMSTEVNRALLELWKMEDVEYQRNSR